MTGKAGRAPPRRRPLALLRQIVEAASVMTEDPCEDGFDRHDHRLAALEARVVALETDVAALRRLIEGEQSSAAIGGAAP